MLNAASAIRASQAVLLDFDGPVCGVFGGLPDHEVAAELRGLLGSTLPDSVAKSPDPFDVLKYAAMNSHGDFIERHLRQLEVRAVGQAPPTPSAARVLHELYERGTPVVIVSNNSSAAVSAYLDAHRLSGLVAGISARCGSQIDQLKPEPYLLARAAELLKVELSECVMVGDSTSDLVAGQNAGARAIGYANRPGKREQFARLRPTAIVDEMSQLIGGETT